MTSIFQQFALKEFGELSETDTIPFPDNSIVIHIKSKTAEGLNLVLKIGTSYSSLEASNHYFMICYKSLPAGFF